MRILFSLLWLAAAGRSPATRAANYNIPLWEEGKVPTSVGDGPLDNPFLTVFAPPTGTSNGGSVIIAPGGSNIMLMYGAEGMEIAERYNDWGVTAFVLTYRLSPRYDATARALDGKRAVELVRSRAAELKIDPGRIGFIGFSAGSAIARVVAAGKGAERPDYVGLIYSVGSAAPGEVLREFPPIFLCAAQYDRGPSLASAQFFIDATKAGAVAELHLLQKGRHGFGSGFGSSEFGEWMLSLKHFLQSGGFLKSGSTRWN
jgi:acetyl esterase/lipase